MRQAKISQSGITTISNTWHRTLVGRFMVKAQWLHFSFHTDNRTRVASICLRGTSVEKTSTSTSERMLTTKTRPSWVNRAATAVHPEGSLKKAGSSSTSADKEIVHANTARPTCPDVLIYPQERFLQRTLPLPVLICFFRYKSFMHMFARISRNSATC